MFLLLGVVRAPAGEALADGEDPEEAEQDDRQAVVSKPSGHDSSSVGWRSNFTTRPAYHLGHGPFDAMRQLSRLLAYGTRCGLAAGRSSHDDAMSDCHAPG